MPIYLGRAGPSVSRKQSDLLILGLKFHASWQRVRHGLSDFSSIRRRGPNEKEFCARILD